ncbi:nuclear transcription factor Y subunit beta isoform X2 [Salvelinus namaycush]|uniref:Nuclear transcription factor Y subunit beta n=1 Tax=Salvelinus namaycush TaxID=8040 RepID=A0A8U1FC07_SALNM|nr:nuclear transcription factor Y subunit beta isoform X2 [Salvelinus namaycush]
MDGDSSTTDASQLGMSGEYMAGSHYVLQSQDDDGDESLHDHEEGNGSKENFREQDIYLPIANVARIMKNAVPQTGKIAKDAKECVQECVSEFISFITSEASERCHQEKRKTINGEDILFAMSTLGFDMYVEPLKLYLQKFREERTVSTAGQTDPWVPECSCAAVEERSTGTICNRCEN